MEQVKEFLRQVVRYRFWISVSVAALLATTAYFVGSRPVRAQADAETKKIIGAEKEVAQYTSNSIPTKDYKPIVVEKTQFVTKDVNSAWKALYDRQAPLLTWPEPVQERFRKWGRKWPENEDPSRVELAKVDYSQAYPEYVDMVYKTFKPFDFETGQGIVAAAPKEALLQPVTFKIEALPGLSVIWAAQERLWIQHTLLEVVAQVNKKAQDWDGAIIKQIVEMVVGDPVAQDQRSLARGDTLAEPEKIKDPKAPEEEAAADAGGGMGAGGAAAGMASMMSGMGGRRGGGGGGDMGGMMGGASSKNAETIFYVSSDAGKNQYKIMPLMMTVLLDENHIQDFLIELENSPMWIQVMDLEIQRPTSRVAKPEKGSSQLSGYGGMAGMGGMMGGMSSMMSSMMPRGGKGGGMTGFGGMMGSMQNQMASSQAMMMGGMGGMRGMGGGVDAAKKGTDNRNVDRAKLRQEAEKAATQAKGPTLFDPHFDIVEVRIYGQARFFNQPPAEEPAEPSMGASADAGTPATTDAAAPAAKDAAPDAKNETPAAKAASPDAKAAAPAPKAASPDAKAAAPAPKDASPDAKAAPAPKDAAPAAKDAAPKK